MGDSFLIYKTEDEAVEVDVRFDNEKETVWLSLDAMSSLFGRNKSTISRHISNIYEEGELLPDSTVANFATVQTEGKRLKELGAGSISHTKAIEKAHSEYKKYQARTLSHAEQDYLDTIRSLGKKSNNSDTI